MSGRARARPLGGGLWLALLLLSAPACRHANSSYTTRGPDMRYKIEYWSNDASDAHPFVLTVTSADAASLLVGSNGDTPGPAAVGTFSARLPAADGDGLLRATTPPALGPAAPAGPANPGELVRAITVTVDDQAAVAHHVTETSPPDPPFAAAEKAALAVAAKVRQHPKLALSAQTLFRFGQGGQVEVVVKLTNAGVDPIAVPHPDRWAADAVQINVTARRNDVALAQMRNEHQVLLTLTRAELTGATPAAPSPAAPIVIAPKQDLTLKLGAALALSTGNYDVWLALDTPLLDAKGAEIMRVELVSEKTQRRAD